MATSAFGRLTVQLGLETAEYQSGLTRAEQITASFSAAAVAKLATVVGAFEHLGGAVVDKLIEGLKALPEQINQQIDLMKTLARQEEALGIAGDTASRSFQGLRFAAKLVGVDADTLQGSLFNLSRALVSAASGNQKTQGAFEALGLSVGQVRDLIKQGDISVAFTEIADRLTQIENPSLRAAVGMLAFGRNYREIAPAIAQGATGIKAATDELERLGGVTSVKAIAAAKELEAQQARLNVAFASAKQAIAEAFVPALDAAIGSFLDARRGATNLGDAVREVFTASTIIEWARAGALALAGMNDQIAATVKQSASIAQIFSATIDIFKNIPALPGGGVAEAAPFQPVAADTVDQQKASLERITRIVEDFQTDWKKRWNEPTFKEATTKFFDDLQTRLQKGKEEVTGKSNIIDPDSIFGALKKVKTDPFDTALEALQKQGVELRAQLANWDEFGRKLNSTAEIAAKFELTSGKFSDATRATNKLEPLSSALKESYLEAARAIDTLNDAIADRRGIATIRDRVAALNTQADAIAKTNLEKTVAGLIEGFEKSAVPAHIIVGEIENITNAAKRFQIATEALSTSAFIRTLKDEAEAYALQTAEIHLTTVEAEKLNSARKIDLELRKATLNADNSIKVQPETFAALTQAAGIAKQIAQIQIDERDRVQRAALTGLDNFLKEYTLKSTNAADLVSTALNNVFSSLEKTFDTFLTTGKFDVASLVDSINAEFRRIIIKEILGEFNGALRALIGQLGGSTGTGGLLGAIGGALGGVFGGGSQTPPVEQLSGPAPAGAGRAPFLRAGVQAAGIAPVTIHNTYQIDSRTDQATIRQIVAQQDARTKNDIQQSFSRNGTFKQAAAL